LIRSRHPTFEDTISSGQRRALLSGDAFLQVDHPDIVAQARVIVSGLEAPTDKADALHDWVYSELIKSPALSIPSALEVLQNRRGDCNEHTVLYTALARAAGLPTRIAIGLVWSDDLDGFYYHAWPEVLIEEVEDGVAAGADSNDGDSHWIALDPTLGQRRADATHLKLLEGGIETWTRLLPFLGSLELEVVSTSEPSAPQARTTRGSSP
jgi:transglutaminase-like putative cysteine protease